MLLLQQLVYPVHPLTEPKGKCSTQTSAPSLHVQPLLLVASGHLLVQPLLLAWLELEMELHVLTTPVNPPTSSVQYA
jgi:hypothetical protein